MHRFYCKYCVITDKCICVFAPDRQIRHRACALKDTVHAIIRDELDEDFEKICEEIKESRRNRGKDYVCVFFFIVIVVTFCFFILILQLICKNATSKQFLNLFMAESSKDHLYISDFKRKEKKTSLHTRIKCDIYSHPYLKKKKKICFF